MTEIHRPSPESETRPGQPAHASASPHEIPEHLKEFVPAVQRFIEKNRELFFSIARDRSLDFKPGPRFFIDLKGGVIYLDVKDWKDMKERGLSEWQIVWSVCHEISHFFDLREQPKEMLENFEYLWRRAKELESRALAILQQKHGDALPPYLTREIPVGKKGERTITVLQKFLYDKLHMLYNCLDDMYVNDSLALRSMIFARNGSQAPEVHRLYRDYLFPTHPREKGKPPEALEAADLTGLPKSYQFAYALLRRRMVPDQQLLLSPEVEAALNAYADTVAERLKRTRAQEVESLTSPGNTKARKPGWRYQRIKETAEPPFIEFLMEDLKDLPPPPPPPPPGGDDGEDGDEPPPPGGDPVKKKKRKPGEKEEEKEPKEGDGDPWKPLDDKPEPIDIDTIRDFIKQQDDKKKEDEKLKKAKEKHDRLTPAERKQEAEKKEDKKIAEQHDVPPHLAEEYRELERSVDPYKRQLAAVFEEIMNTVSQRVTLFWVEGFRSGKFDIKRFINKYGADLAAKNEGTIPWDALDVYDQREIMSRLVLFPDRIRVRFVLDGSGSMNTDRILAVKQLAVLFLEALSTFEATINLRFRLKDPMHVDTEIRMFGDAGSSVIVKSFAGEKLRHEEETADRFRGLGAIHSGYGGTCDAEPMWAIADSIPSQLTSDLKAGKAKEFVFEITDGGSNGLSGRAKEEDTAGQDTRNAVDAVEKAGVVARGFQIGEPSDEEKKIFDSIWGESGARIPHPKDLAPALAELLASELRKTEVQIQYYGEDEGT